MMKKNMALLILSLLSSMPFAFAGVSTSSAPIPPNFHISSSPMDLCRGQINYIPVTVTNVGISPLFNIGGYSLNGPTMQNIQLSIAASKSGYSFGNGTVSAQDLNATNSTEVMLPFFLDANASSVISLGVAINYYFDIFYSDSETRNLTFATQTCGSPLSISVSPLALTTATRQNLSFNFTNNGAYQISNISMKVSASGGDLAWLDGSAPIEIASLAPHTSLIINKSVFVSFNASQFFPLNVSANFYNGTKLGQVYNNIMLLSSGVINLTPSSMTISPVAVSPGGIFSVSFVLTNFGTESATTATVTASQPEGISPFGSNSVFVGTISQGGQVPVTLSFTVSNHTAPGEYEIPIKVDYLNSLRSSLSTEVNNVSINVIGSQQFNSSSHNSSSPVIIRRSAAAGGSTSGGILVPVLAITTIVFFVLYIMERRKKRNVK